MGFCRKRGFTLVELMVVIAIIGILAAALITPITNARATGRSARCKANLKNLAQASMSYALDTRSWPHGTRHWGNRLPSAGTYEVREPSGNVDVLQFLAVVGWVSGYYGGSSFLWPSLGQPTLRKGADDRASYYFYGDNKNAVYQSITNGVLWNYVGKDLATYVCDEHKAVARALGINNVMRSYAMNAYFGANLSTSFASSSAPVPRDREWVTQIDNISNRGNAGAMLLFAELPAYDVSGERSINKDLGPSDGIVDVEIRGYSSAKPSNEEFIGFNHSTAKRRVAHVSFVDGHVEAIIAPQNASKTDLQNLTFLLCNGIDVPPDKNEWRSARDTFK